MKTKIVYVLVSTDSDIYLEQLWVSMFSLKSYNPDSHIVLVTDMETSARLKYDSCKELIKFIDEIVEQGFDPKVSGKERSRYLKTNLRCLISGDFLFIDTDTIITGDLSKIDTVKSDVSIVLDLHCQLNNHPYEKTIRKLIRTLYGGDLKEGTNYFNSGVMLVRDTPKAHTFFAKWHNNWLEAKGKKHGIQDQQSLAFTINDTDVVEPLDGIYNCQILGSIEYLAKAKIVHFFNNQWFGEALSPFFDKNFYLEIKGKGCLTDEIQRLILNCKSSFVSPSMPIGREDMKLCVSPSFKMLRVISRHQGILKVMNKFSSLLLKLTGNI